LIKWSWVQLPVRSLSDNNSRQVVQTHVPLSLKQYNLVPAKR